MSYGVNILNNSSTIQINQDLTTAKLITSGSSSYNQEFLNINLPNNNIAAPIIFVKPNNTGQFVGVLTHARIDNNTYKVEFLAETGGFSWAIFSPTCTSPVTETVSYGLEVYTSTGGIAYSSKNKHPQITHLFYKPSIFSGACYTWTFQNSGWNNATYALSGYTSMPWIMVNNLTAHWAGVGPYSDELPGYMGKINSGYTSATFDLRNVGGYWSFPRVSQIDCQFDLYSALPEGAWFGVGKYD